MKINYNFSKLLLLTWITLATPIAAEPQWQPLFNGKNLDGWTAKFTGRPLGENFLQTFRVEDGHLLVSYNNWPEFDRVFGHLFYDVPYSNYKIRAKYRFVGEQMTKGPAWALRNNGLMLHSQAPDTMALDQSFPTSIEVQLLGGDGTNKRPTGNLCTPNSSVVIDGKRVHQHCIESGSKTFHGEQWVEVEVTVRNSQEVVHKINGETVMVYTDLLLDAELPDEVTNQYDDMRLNAGYIAIQAETHPTEFAYIEILPLGD